MWTVAFGIAGSVVGIEHTVVVWSEHVFVEPVAVVDIGPVVRIVPAFAGIVVDHPVLVWIEPMVVDQNQGQCIEPDLVGVDVCACCVVENWMSQGTAPEFGQHIVAGRKGLAGIDPLSCLASIVLRFELC